MSDQTPEARLAADERERQRLLAAQARAGLLDAAEYDTLADPEARRWLRKHEACPIAWFEHDGGFLRCNDHDDDSPTLAADLALAAAVRELEDITEMSYDPSLRRGQWDVRINDHVGVGDTLTAAIEAAKEASE